MTPPAINAKLPAAEPKLSNRKGHSGFAHPFFFELEHSSSHSNFRQVTSMTLLALILLLILIGSIVAIGLLMLSRQQQTYGRENRGYYPERGGFRSAAPAPAPRWGKPSSAQEAPQRPFLQQQPPPLQNRAASQPSMLSPSQKRHLCPGLVVPRGNECVLALPARASALGALTIDIREMNGAAMLKAEILDPTWFAGDLPSSGSPSPYGGALQGGTAPTISLRSTHGPKPLIAYCRAISDASGRRSVYVYDSHDELHAHVTKVGGTSSAGDANPCYALTSGRNGLQMLFSGSFGTHVINVFNEQRGVLADTEPAEMQFDPAGAYYRLRVTERIDVGLVICALLSIDLMESK